jgi:hypothetical protein
VALGLGRWAAGAATMGAVACGVGVAQPISAGVVATTDGATPDMPGADPLSQGLLAYWKLDEGGANDVVVDSSGNGHSGTTVNGPLPSSMTPPVRFLDPSSRGFNGTNQYIVLGNPDDMNFEGQITLAAWVYIAAITTGCHYILAHGYCYDPPGEVALRLGSDNCGPGGSPHNWAAGAWLSAEHSAVAPLYDLDLKVWIHIAGVYDGQAWHLYRNGEEIARQDSTVGAIPVRSDWAIGARSPGTPPCTPPMVERFFNGSIDDVRIYRRALGPSEIEELYHR